MKNFIVLFAVLILAGCSSDDERDCCTNIDTGVAIKYIHEDGENLFEKENGLTEADLTIYHKINSEWVRYFEGNLDSPKGIRIDEREEGTYLVVFPSTTVVENKYTETKIEFSESDFDILKTEMDQSNSNKVVTKVWYNDELKWEGNQSPRKFEIIK